MLNTDRIEALIFSYKDDPYNRPRDLLFLSNKYPTTIELIGYSMNLFDGSPSYVDIHKVASVISEQDDESTIMNVIAKVFDQFDADALSRWKLYKDAKQTLNKLKNNGKLLGLVTNVGSKAINSAIKKLELDDIFRIVITRNHVSRLKPDPEGLLTKRMLH